MCGYCVLENESNGHENGLRPKTRSFGVFMISVTIQHQIICASNSSLERDMPPLDRAHPRSAGRSFDSLRASLIISLGFWTMAAVYRYAVGTPKSNPVRNQLPLSKYSSAAESTGTASLQHFLISWIHKT